MTEDASSNGQAPVHAFRSAAAVGLLVAIAAAGLAADLISKHLVFEALLNDPDLVANAKDFSTRIDLDTGKPPTPRQVLARFQRPVCFGLKLTLSTNPGVVFGWSMPRWAVIVSTVLTVGLVGWFFATSDRRAWPMHTAMAFILAGAMGNLYDRLYSSVAPIGMGPIRRNVRDFIDCSDLGYGPVYNIADVLLVAGVGIVVLHWIVAARREAKARKADD